jgi:hypothetical protein
VNTEIRTLKKDNFLIPLFSFGNPEKFDIFCILFLFLYIKDAVDQNWTTHWLNKFWKDDKKCIFAWEYAKAQRQIKKKHR